MIDPVKVNTAKALIADRELLLKKKLSEGERFDLLMYNTKWQSLEIKDIVANLALNENI